MALDATAQFHSNILLALPLSLRVQSTFILRIHLIWSPSCSHLSTNSVCSRQSFSLSSYNVNVSLLSIVRMEERKKGEGGSVCERGEEGRMIKERLRNV